MYSDYISSVNNVILRQNLSKKKHRNRILRAKMQSVDKNDTRGMLKEEEKQMKSRFLIKRKNNKG